MTTPFLKETVRAEGFEAENSQFPPVLDQTADRTNGELDMALEYSPPPLPVQSFLFSLCVLPKIAFRIL